MNKKKIVGILLCCVAVIAVAGIVKCSRKIEPDIIIKPSEKAFTFEDMMRAGKKQSDAEMMKMVTSDSPLFHRTGKQTLPKYDITHTPEVFECGGENVYALSNPGYDKVVIYFHGGAFVFEITRNHVELCDRLVNALNAKVIMPLYPLGPEAKWRRSYEMVTEVYKEALKENKPVYLIGDSAGAVIALGLAMQLKQDGLPPAEKIVLISPSPDATFSNKELREYEKKDVILPPRNTLSIFVSLWADKKELKDYHISPLYGNLEGLPDILLFTGNCEMLYPDNLLLYKKLIKAGNNTMYVLGDGLQHIFPILTGPEMNKSVDIIKDYIKGK